MKNSVRLLILLPVIAFNFTGFKNAAPDQEKTGTVKISFVNMVKGEPLQLHNVSYTNPFNEAFTVSKFKYYISHVNLSSATGTFKEDEEESYHLIDESKPISLSFSFPATVNTYHDVSFMLGVDSLKNVSGAQTGALDPLNDMFWTWNSGYIMAKMEGNSPQSKMVNHKVEFHIGGFSGESNVIKNLTLHFPGDMLLKIEEGKTSEITIEADLNTWWQQPNDLKITEHPVCSVPGALANQFADNYSKMFSIKKIINN